MAHCKNVGGVLACTLGGAPGGDGGDRPHCFTVGEKRKKVVSKKRKVSDREAEATRVVAAVAEAVYIGGQRASLWIGSELTTTSRRVVLQLE